MLRYTWLLCTCMVFFIESEIGFCENTKEGKKNFFQILENAVYPAKQENRPYPCPKVFDRPMDCAEIRLNGHNTSGVYTIWPKSRVLTCESVKAYCNMDIDGGGWTVIQRRGNFSKKEDYFYRNWEEYKKGFGKLDEDFWFGNENIYAVTNQKLYSVRFDLTDFEEVKAYAVYEKFWIDREDESYLLHIDGYYGDAGDSMKIHDKEKFTTRDKKNDKITTGNCAEKQRGGWWYYNCGYANLNGLYIRGSSENGTTWYNFRGSKSLKSTEIMIRPFNFVKP
ncbi:techylectin-5A-like [Stegodyphus dumicola]|uniref:techylectin-5A-like n=1 Tax=Stegodyphus dumicola TaxID=202533 RepID=UPI0015ABCD17|nr:techylectin-5A-like [Stegodyphus dumicola]